MEAIRRPPTLFALLLLAALAAAGCGRQVSTSTAYAPTTTTTIASTPSPTVDPNLDPTFVARCGLSQADLNTLTQAKDMLITKPTLLLGYPAVQLPDQTPLKPLQVSTQNSNNALRSGQFPGAAAVNPGVLEGSTRRVSFVASICNGSTSATHVVQSVSVIIVSLTPYTGQVTVWPGCDGAFSRQHPNNAHSGGCGGGVATEEQVQATFLSGAREGTSVVATQVGFSPPPNNPSLGPLPVTLAPGHALSFSVTVSVPDMVGTYAFGISYQVDYPPAVGGYTADPFLAAPVARSFTGAACNTPSMLAQIPAATTPETYYICPQ
ncbi:MAG: hypothetical protein ACXWQZ_09150 [Ktedonobacterales bacterium]